MKRMSLFATMAALLLANPAFAATTLVPHEAEYKVKISGISARLNTQLRDTGEGYVANHVIKPAGFMARLLTRGRMNVTAEFATVPNGVIPDRYQSVDTIRDKPAVDLKFDWQTNQATGTVGTEDIVLALEGMSYDSVSIQYALMHDLLSDNVGDQYRLFDVDKMRVATISDAGQKTVKTKAGKFRATGVRHQKEGSSRVTTLWCVEELGYLPVIIEQHRKGKLKFRATLVRYTPSPDKSTPEVSTASAP